jgi:NAD(P)-dependent dehydrogenase (short-subunit alcohol dehydrogenase family)
LRLYDARVRSDRGLLGPLHVLVTGASSGIGAQIARAYARRGARVALFARRRGALDSVAAACRIDGAADAVVLAGDVTRRDDIAAAFDVLDRRWPRLDRAVLNAGTAIRDEAARSFVECCTSDAQTAIGFDAAVAETIVRTNLFGVIFFLEPVLTRMRDGGGGRIAVTGSMAADGLLHRSGPYMASKAALRALIDGLRLDACNLNIGLTLLEPGFVSTGMTDGIPYRMPFLLTAERCAETFVRGIEAGADRIRTPWQMAAINYFAGYVPRPLRNRAAMWLAERT